MLQDYMKPDQSVCCVEDIVNQLRPILSHKTLDNVIQLLALLFVLPYVVQLLLSVHSLLYVD